MYLSPDYDFMSLVTYFFKVFKGLLAINFPTKVNSFLEFFPIFHAVFITQVFCEKQSSQTTKSLFSVNNVNKCKISVSVSMPTIAHFNVAG